MLKGDALDDGFWKRSRASDWTWGGTRVPGLEVLPDEPLDLADGDQALTPGVFTVSIAGATCRSIVEMLTPSASAACLRLYAKRSSAATSRSW